jgi:hypothetical protein
MPFKSKAQIAAEQETGAAVNASVAAEKKEKKNDVAAEVKAQRELYEKNQEIEDLKKELELAKNQPKPVATNAPGLNEIADLRAQINLLASQVRTGATGDKLKFRMPTAADLVPQEKAVTFTARSVFYVVGSYMDKNGLECLPPFKLIVFTYAASDIRKEGREEEIKNFSTYTTNLQPEIDFLRASPYYGITYSENTNEMMSEDTKETQFKVAAATALQSATPEAVFDKANELKIPNWRSKSASELRGPIITEMVKEYKKREEEIQKDIIQRNMLRTQPVEQE